MHFTKKGCIAVPEGETEGQGAAETRPSLLSSPGAELALGSNSLLAPSPWLCSPDSFMHPGTQAAQNKDGCDRDIQHYQREVVMVATQCKRDFSESSHAPTLCTVTYALALKHSPSSVAQSAGGHPRSPGRRLASACTRKERQIGD